jgi:tripartite-type tricarboxylate transporter receptor subunit TctC
MKTLFSSVARVLAVAASAAVMAPAQAAPDDYPKRPISLVVGFSAGGPTDTVARYLARKLEAELGQPVVVDNRAGANGVVALQAVKRASPDGYTLMLGSSGTLSIEPVYKRRVDYDVLKDFTPVAMVASYPYLLVVPRQSTFKDVGALIGAAKAHSGEISFASAGTGAVNHLAGEWFAKASQVKLSHIPYKGDSAALTDLAAGRVDMAFLSVAAARPQMDAGKIRALAVATPEPSPVAPGLPTVAQAAGIPGFAAEPWNGVMGPAGMPEAVTRKLNAAIQKVMGTEEARTTLLAYGQFPRGGSPDDFARQIRTQTQRWQTVIQTANIAREE